MSGLQLPNRCRKCGTVLYDNFTMAYCEAETVVVDACPVVNPEHIEVKCDICGYSFEVRCADRSVNNSGGDADFEVGVDVTKSHTDVDGTTVIDEGDLKHISLNRREEDD